MPTEQLALSPNTWPFTPSLLPEAAYLVGGSVRDALLGRRADYLDLDFVLPAEAIATAQAIAQQYDAGFVVLDADHQIARIVFERATVDFAQQVGPTLEADLARRDFTINAIAYHPRSETLVDPRNGYQDLQQRRLRMIAPANLAEDPLRLLRAYRQAAQLGFTIDPATQATIAELVPLIDRVAAERIRGELDCLLSLAQGTPLLRQAYQDGVLGSWLPQMSDAGLEAVAAIDATFAELRESHPAWARQLSGWVREQSVPGLHRSWLKATKLSQLLAADPEMAEATLVRLKYSRAEQQIVLAILQGWQRLRSLLEQGLPSRRQQYLLFKQVGSSFVGIALLALAEGCCPSLVYTLLDRYLDPTDPVAHPPALVTGRDLIQTLQLKPGPRIGELLEAIQLAQAEGEVNSREEALAWAIRQLP